MKKTPEHESEKRNAQAAVEYVLVLILIMGAVMTCVLTLYGNTSSVGSQIGNTKNATKCLLTVGCKTSKVVFSQTGMSVQTEKGITGSGDLIAALVQNGVREKNATELTDWMQNAISPGAAPSKTEVIIPAGVAPDAIMLPAGTGSLIRKYLDAGGTVIWVGDPPGINTPIGFASPKAKTTSFARLKTVSFAGSGTINLTALPNNSMVLVNGTYQGNATPSISLLVTTGNTYNITVQYPGYTQNSTIITPMADMNLTLALAPCLPDLVLANITRDLSNYNVKVSNLGCAVAGNNTELFIVGTQNITVPLGPLLPNYNSFSGTPCAAFGDPGCNQSINTTAYVDYYNDIIEFNESNNMMSAAFAPALQNGTMNVTSAPMGAGIYINGTYYGLTPASVPLAPDRYFDVVTMPGYANQTMLVNIGSNLTTTAHFVFNTSCKPDLQVSSITRDASGYTTTVCNNGCTISFSSSTTVVKNGGMNVSSTLGNTFPGSCKSFTAPCNQLGNAYCNDSVTVTGYADYSNIVSESDETNNVLSVIFTPTPTPTPSPNNTIATFDYDPGIAQWPATPSNCTVTSDGMEFGLNSDASKNSDILNAKRVRISSLGSGTVVLASDGSSYACSFVKKYSTAFRNSGLLVVGQSNLNGSNPAFQQEILALIKDIP